MVKENGGGDGDIEGVDRVCHRDGYGLVGEGDERGIDTKGFEVLLQYLSNGFDIPLQYLYQEKETLRENY